jgi:acetyltransferase-like isoleucine patch superfamily enzyme
MSLDNFRLALRALIDPFFYINFVKVVTYKFSIYTLRMYRFNNGVKKRFPQLVNRTDLIIERPNDCEIDPTVYFGKDVRLVFSLLSEAGKDKLIIKNNVYICERVELGVERNSTLTIGEHTFIRENSRLLGNVTVGNYCQISQNVYIGAGSHIFDSEPWLYIRDQDAIYFKKNDSTFVEIHDDVFIGANVYIKSNTIIGKGAVIGANAAVINDVLPYSIIGSNGLKIRDRIQFLPPRHLSYLEDQHLPYLYSGIACDVKNITTARDIGGLKFNSGSAIFVMNLDDASFFRILLRTYQPNFLITNLAIKVNGLYQDGIKVEQSEYFILINFDLKIHEISLGNKIFNMWDCIEISMDSLPNLLFVEADAIQILKAT